MGKRAHRKEVGSYWMEFYYSDQFGVSGSNELAIAKALTILLKTPKEGRKEGSHC